MATMQKVLSGIRELHTEEYNLVSGGAEVGPDGPQECPDQVQPSYADTTCHNGVCFQDRID